MWQSLNELKVNGMKHFFLGYRQHHSDNADVEHFHHSRKFYWAVSLQGIFIILEHFIPWLEIALGSDRPGFESCICHVTVDKLSGSSEPLFPHLK